MDISSNPWDALGNSVFSAKPAKGTIDPRAADNILIAWPPMLSILASTFPNPGSARVVDFGCGTGAFCHELKKIGYDASGVDSSEGMIAAAKNHFPSGTYTCGNQSCIARLGPYDAVVSVMALQFIDDTDNVFSSVSRALETGGIFVFAVFNPVWVNDCLRSGLNFSGFDQSGSPRNGMVRFEDRDIPVHIRDTREYDSIASRYGLRKIAEAYPPFTDDFKAAYPEYKPVSSPEYLILAYRNLQYG